MLHLPFQSGNSRVLKAMNRGYTARIPEAGAAAAAHPRNIVLTSDVIVGFPGETEEEFEDTLSLIEAVRYDALFTFIFSPRAGTPAAKLADPTPKEQKNRQFPALCPTAEPQISLEIHQGYIGKTFRCSSTAKGRDGLLTARTDGGRLIHLKADPAASAPGSRRRSPGLPPGRCSASSDKPSPRGIVGPVKLGRMRATLQIEG